MFYPIGSPVPLSSLDRRFINVSEVKPRVEIAVLDDDPFSPKEALTNHGFKIVEVGPDIKALSQVSSYPIIVCDVTGVGRAFGSDGEGAHVVAEIRKEYPDKFIIGYTGQTHNINVTKALAHADKRMAKDESIEVWVQNLELGIKEVMNPKNRWVRMRRALLDRGVELFDVLCLEQSFIKSINSNNSKCFEEYANKVDLGAEIKDTLVKFAANVFVGLIGSSVVA